MAAVSKTQELGIRNLGGLYSGRSGVLNTHVGGFPHRGSRRRVYRAVDGDVRSCDHAFLALALSEMWQDLCGNVVV